MFFRLPTGVFTLYVKRLFSFFLFQYSFQLCIDFGMFGRQILLFSDGEWKYIAPSNGAAYAKLTNIELGNSKEEQLYNLKQDIGEKKNLAAEHPEIVAKLKAILEKEKAK